MLSEQERVYIVVEDDEDETESNSDPVEMNDRKSLYEAVWVLDNLISERGMNAFRVLNEIIDHSNTIDCDKYYLKQYNDEANRTEMEKLRAQILYLMVHHTDDSNSLTRALKRLLLSD